MDFNININASPEKVWNTLWDDTTYPQWTEPFMPGSRAETDWKKGSKVLFLGKDDSGMVASIEENIPNRFMSIRHSGVMYNGKEEFESEEAKQWAGSLENYTLKPVADGTELIINMSGAVVPKEMEDYFVQAWPKALQAVKKIAESAK